MKPEAVVYADGSCDNMTGLGGWGAVLLAEHNGGQVKKELSGPLTGTTNNRAEIVSVIEALNTLKVSCKVWVHSDSAYVVNSMKQGWVYAWREKDWIRFNKKTRREEETPNRDLWERLIEAVESHDVIWVKVKGHAGVYYNELADHLAGEEYRKLADAARKDQEEAAGRQWERDNEIKALWPQESIELYEKFGHESALLMPFAENDYPTLKKNRKILCRFGKTDREGIALQCLGEMVQVVLDDQREIEPVMGKSRKPYTPMTEVPIKNVRPK